MMPSTIAIELAAALCIAFSGVPGLLRRSGATGQRIATTLNGIGSALGLALVGLFHWAVRSRQAPPELHGAFPTTAQFRSEVPDAVLDCVVLPLMEGADRGLSRLRGLQRGPVQMYLLYVLVAVVAVLLVAR